MKQATISSVITALLLVICSVVPGTAATKFGVIYDISGKAEIISPAGKSFPLERGKHILLPVKVGDRIKTLENSRVIVVSMNNKTGYEIVPNSEARVENGAITVMRGNVKISSGYAVPSGQSSGPIGAMVLRGHDSSRCLIPLSPSNGSIITLTPTLSWSVACKDIKPVSVRVTENSKLLFETAANGISVKMPAGVLKYGGTYAWSIDSGQAAAVAENKFSIPSEAMIKSIEEKMAMNAQENDLTKRLSYLFFLANNDLNDQARYELEQLQKEFPDNEYLKEL